jgi:hypothetical protein
MGYGYEVKEINDRTVKAAKKMVQLMGEIALPGALLVNILPFCESSFGIEQAQSSLTLVRHIPEWLPWLSYKPLARYGYDIGQVVFHVPMEFARESIVSMRAFKDV